MGLESSLALITDTELEGVAQNMVESARLACDLGYDFVDVKCCHGYLMHEVLGARGRVGSYGGSFENRTKLLLSVIDEIRIACPTLGIGVRLSLVDRFPHLADPDSGAGAPVGMAESLPYTEAFGVDAAHPLQFDFTEPFALVAKLQEHGVEAINVSIGSPYYVPHLQRPAAYPPSDGYLPPRDPLMDVFEHIAVIREAKRAHPDMVFVSSGLSYLQEYLPHVMQHEMRNGLADVAGLGRMALVYPEMPFDILRGATLQKKLICRTFSDCTTAPRHGLLSGCYPLDEHYKALPERAQLKEIKRSQRDNGARS
jgi:2,4-dienoyl-CoA reductase-like NADH-dependent reductase (Old Yellow Enzyme family)